MCAAEGRPYQTLRQANVYLLMAKSALREFGVLNIGVLNSLFDTLARYSF